MPARFYDGARRSATRYGGWLVPDGEWLCGAYSEELAGVLALPLIGEAS